MGTGTTRGYTPGTSVKRGFNAGNYRLTEPSGSMEVREASGVFWNRSHTAALNRVHGDCRNLPPSLQTLTPSHALDTRDFSSCWASGCHASGPRWQTLNKILAGRGLGGCRFQALPPTPKRQMRKQQIIRRVC